jgi:hypothetical protein
VTPAGSVAVDPGAPFAWSPDGERVALGRGGLRLWSPADGRPRRLTDGTPTALAWSPAGDRLAAAYGRGDHSLLRLHALSGAVLAETTVPGEVRDLFWPGEGGLLFAATTLRRHSFGGGFLLTLYRWSGTGAPQGTPLHDVTLKPLTLRQWGGLLGRIPALALSPLGDEIAYGRLHDPPAFSPYLRLVVRHLESGAEREVTSRPLPGAGALFAADGEGLLYDDGPVTRAIEPWSGRRQGEWRGSGAPLALSPGGRWLLAGDRLYRDGIESSTFAGLDAAAFAPAGGRLLLRRDGRLFVLAGLEEIPPPPPEPAARGPLLWLRRWRATGLITPEEYLAQKQRILDR